MAAESADESFNLDRQCSGSVITGTGLEQDRADGQGHKRAASNDGWCQPWLWTPGQSTVGKAPRLGPLHGSTKGPIYQDGGTVPWG